MVVLHFDRLVESIKSWLGGVVEEGQLTTRALLLGLFVTAWAAFVMMLIPVSPEVQLEAAAHAVRFVPTSDIDLVASAGRSLLEDAGVRLDPPSIYMSEALEERPSVSGGEVLTVTDDSRPIQALRQLELTRGCWAQLEAYADGVQLEIGAGTSRGGQRTCSVTIEGYTPAPNARDREIVRYRWPGRDPTMILRFRPERTWRMTGLGIDSLAFTAFERRADQPQSSLISGTIKLLDVDETMGLFLRDDLHLGGASGEILELGVGDSVDVRFAGVLDGPTLGTSRSHRRVSESSIIRTSDS